MTKRVSANQAAFLSLKSILPKALTKQRTAATNKTSELTPTAGTSRYVSSDRTPRDDGDKLTWQELIFGPNDKKERTPLEEGDIRVALEEQSGSIFQRRSLTAKAALDPRLRCTEVDGDGKVIMVDGELKKSELIAKVRWTEIASNLYLADGCS